MSANTPPLQRRLTFYSWESLDDDQPFDPIVAGTTLEALPDIPGRSVPAGDFEVDAFAWPAFSVPAASAAQVMRYRDFNSRPYVRAPGAAPHPVNMQPSEFILDVSHCVLWPDHFAAFDQGGHSPTPAAYATFARERLNQLVIFRPLFDKSAIDRLKDLRGLKRVQFRMRNSQVTQGQVNAQQGPLRGLFSELFGWQGEVVVSADISVSSRGQGARDRVLDGVTPEDVQRAVDRADRMFDSFVVSGIRRDGRVEKVDLFHSRLAVDASLPRATAGGYFPGSQTAFDALVRARTELESNGRLETAVVAWN